jgi:soluble lytic murein transglycosylase-like protein
VACKITQQVPNASKASFQLICDQELVGFIDLEAVKFQGHRAWNVEGVFVDPSRQRQGHATRLYEKAADFACSKHEPLVSTNRSDLAHSNDFWTKQEKKGRAQIVRGAGRYDRDAYVLTSCPAPGQHSDLSGLTLSKRNVLIGAGALAVLALILVKKAPVSEPLTVPSSRRYIGPILDAAGAKYGVPASLMRATAYVESRWSPTAGSGKGAVGVMQLMPEVAKNLGVTDRTDPKQSAEGGAKFLASLYKKAGSWDVALAAYNWGPGNVFGNDTKPPKMYSSQWPAATQQYVREILDAQQRGVS